MTEQDLYELEDKEETKMAVVVSLLALAAVLYLAIEIYNRPAPQLDAGLESTATSSKYGAIAEVFQKK